MTKLKEEEFIYALVDMANFINHWSGPYVMKELKKFDLEAFNGIKIFFDNEYGAQRQVAALLRAF